MTLALEGMYHVGVVVEDLDAAVADFTAQLGMSWAPLQNRELTVRHKGRLVTTDLRFTYSVEGPPHLELIEAAATAGTPWEPAGAMHHVGFWAEDLTATAASLQTAGLDLETTYDTPTGELLGFGYFMGPAGLRLEVVDAARRPGFDQWLSGGAFPAAAGN
jgi:catechol 2,3-dioxygenase-like lactoylglutathione lyase family enzyme